MCRRTPRETTIDKVIRCICDGVKDLQYQNVLEGSPKVKRPKIHDSIKSIRHLPDGSRLLIQPKGKQIGRDTRESRVRSIQRFNEIRLNQYDTSQMVQRNCSPKGKQPGKCPRKCDNGEKKRGSHECEASKGLTKFDQTKKIPPSWCDEFASQKGNNTRQIRGNHDCEATKGSTI